MLGSGTSLPLRQTTRLRRFLKSIEVEAKQLWRRQRLAMQSWQTARAASKIDLSELAGRCAHGPLLPLVCVVDVLEPPRLDKCLRSLVRQCYDRWRLELVALPQDRAHIQAVLDSVAGHKQKIRVSYVDEARCSVATAIGCGIAACAEDHVGVLCCRDQLAEDALIWVAATLCRHPTAGWIYADDAAMNDAGCVDDFHYKPDFSWLYLLARFFTGPFGFYRRDLLSRVITETRVAGRSGYYDLALRVSEAVDRRDVIHIPQILSFRPSLEEGAAESQLAATEDLSVVAAALDRRGILGRVSVHPRSHVLHEFHFQPRACPKVSIIIPTRNASTLVRACVDALRQRSRYAPYEIVVIDHESDEPALLDYLDQHSSQGVLRVVPYRGRFNFAEMSNRAIGTTDAELVLLLNNDVDGFSDGWLEQLVATMQLNERVGAVGPLLYYPDGTIQHAGIFFGLGKTGRHGHIDLPHDALGYCGRLRSLQEVSCLTGAMLLLRRSAFEEIGGFDTKYPEDYNDTDLCLRLRQSGYRIVYTPHVTAFHYSSKTRNTRFSNRRTMIRQWKATLRQDPFYSPHLSNQRFELSELNHLWAARKKVDLEAYLRHTATVAGQKHNRPNGQQPVTNDE